MRAPISIIAAVLLGSMVTLRAGDTTAPAADASVPVSTDSTPAPTNLKMSYEFDADTSYVGDARTNFGGGVSGNVSEQNEDAKFLVEPQVNDGPIYRFGLSYSRYNFGISQAAPIPDILQAENLVLGIDFEVFNSVLVRIEADPGLYNDGRASGYRDFNVPFTIGGSYIAGEDVQWVAGLEVDFNRQIPVFPAVGFRWQFRDQWVLDAILPTPRLEFDENKDLTLYLGGDVDDGTYRMDQGLGVGFDDTYHDLTGRTIGAHLGGTIVEYDEVRIGTGFSWKASKAITLELECGYLPYREFDFHRADVHLSNNSGAPYGQLSLSAQF